uniref:Uncharacterized protein n=1 Tax=Anguilla anguilla TaxID=7936 RepID=A0A0E9TM04_ANGAN
MLNTCCIWFVPIKYGTFLIGMYWLCSTHSECVWFCWNKREKQHF